MKNTGKAAVNCIMSFSVLQFESPLVVSNLHPMFVLRQSEVYIPDLEGELLLSVTHVRDLLLFASGLCLRSCKLWS
jgi:hypothetical protein